jgi:hypothetical protein
MGQPFDQYGSTIMALLREAPPCPLDAGEPNAAVESQLSKLTAADLFAGRKIVDRESAEACLSGLWLRHNYLDRSHTISQSLHSTTGSFWHGMMHRREPDYSNAAYWFRRVGEHPVYGELGRQARHIAQASERCSASRLLSASERWDALGFIDLVRHAIHHGGADLQLGIEIQQCEWDLLFDYCYRQAVGSQAGA